MFTDIMKNRRSIRKYKNDPIKDDDIKTIIEAGMFAPTANNKQPWHFIVVTDRQILRNMMASHPYMGMLNNAPCAIIVCGDTDISPDGYYIPDCAAATQNILLAATALSYGTCWCGLYPKEERMDAFSKIFALPKNIKPFSAIVLGVADEVKPTPNRYKQERLHINKW